MLWDVFSTVWKVFLRAFGGHLDCWNWSSIPGVIVWMKFVTITLTSSHYFFTNTLSLLSLSIPIYQSGHLLRLSALSILLSNTCFSIKSNLDRYNAYFACLWFNFWLLMKYSRFLWSLQISNFICVPSSRCLYSSGYQIIASIFLL